MNHHLNNPNGTIKRIPTPSHRRHDGLIQYAYNNTSQSGEDGIIEKLFEWIPTQKNVIQQDATDNISNDEDSDDNIQNTTRWCVDVGAWDGRHLSNTFSLLSCSGSSSSSSISSSTKGENNNNNNSKKNKKKGVCWKGILIEADCEKFQSLHNLHKPLGNECWNVTVSCLKHSKQSLSYLLQNRRALDVLPMNFEFLCIDVDGTDYWLLHDILHASSFRPQVICIEFNPTMPHDLLYIQPRDDTIRHGSSLAALVALAGEFHYQLVECTCYNAFFVKVDLFEKYVRDKIPFEPTMEAVHEVTMGTALYQLYDGTLKLHGCKTMLWHRLPIPDIQVLDKEERSFPFVPSSSSSTGSAVSVVEKKTEDGWTWEDQSEEEMFQSISVDMSPYCHPDFIIGDEEEKVKCSQELLKQLETDGFALVRGTTISSELCKDALYWTDEFLHRAPEAVRRSCLTKDRARRGYSPQNAENFASLIGQKGPNDLVKKFRVGPEMAEGREDTFGALVQPNAWPLEEVWGEENSKTFQRVIEEYYEKLCDMAHAIVACIRDGIRNASENDLSHLEESLTMRNESHTSILTLLGYRKGARHQGCKIPLVAAHTDVGVITVLLFDDGDCAALQRAEGDNWVDVRIPKSVPTDPIFVVNIGDCLSDLCGGKLPSTMHRVMPRNGKEGKPRNTLALFVGFQPDQKLCINNSLMTYEEWRKNKIAKAQAKARERSA